MSSIISQKRQPNAGAERDASAAHSTASKSYASSAKDLLIKAVDPRGAMKLAGALVALASPKVATAGRPDPSSCTVGFSASSGTQAFGVTGPCSDVSTYLQEFSLCNITQNASALGEAVVKVSSSTVSLLTDAANSANFTSDYTGNVGPNRTSAQSANICLNNGLNNAGWATFVAHDTTSTGTIVGLAVGLGGGALLAAAVTGACLFKRRNRRLQAEHAAEAKLPTTTTSAGVELTEVTPAA